MSGVFGVADTGHQLDLNRLIGEMTNVLSHRPWYVSESFIHHEQGVALGRLGIDIFNRGSQPIWNATRTVALAMAGEFYRVCAPKGLVPPTGSDEEVALWLYETMGETFASALEGIFVIAIWDAQRQALIIANDRFGVYPLYYAFYSGRLVFAPEVMAVLADPAFRRKPDAVALAEYVRFQFLLGTKTFFEDIKLLSGASILHFDLNEARLSVRKYWDWDQLPVLPASISFRDAVEETGIRLRNAVNTRARGTERLGVYLSGGLDSRAIVGSLDRSCQPVTTITYGRKGCRDLIYAGRMARVLGSQHHCFEINDGLWIPRYVDLHLELSEGFHSWIHAHGISILEQVRSLIDVNLTGFHGDELNWSDAGLYAAADDEAFLAHLYHLMLYRSTWPSCNEGEERLLFSDQLAGKMQGVAFDSLRQELAAWQHLPIKQRIIAISCDVDRRFYQYYTVFHRSHMEMRFPYLDYDYCNWVYSLPPEMLLNRRLRRAVISRFMPALARVPYDKDGLPVSAKGVWRIGAKTMQRAKRVLNHQWSALFPDHCVLATDYEGWLRHELRDWGAGILLGPRMLERGLFRPEFLRSLWQRQQAGVESNIIGKLAPLMTYEMMLERFYD